MNKGLKKLFIFELLFSLINIINIYLPKVLLEYQYSLLMSISLIVFFIMFGFEKDKHRYTKDIIYDILIITISSFILYYILGIFTGFTYSHTHYSFKGLLTFVLPVILTISLKEYLRYNVLQKCSESFFSRLVAVLLFIICDICINFDIMNISTIIGIFKSLALIITPIIINNIVCTYISLKTGYKPNIIWLLVLNLYRYLIPIVPNINEYLLAIFSIIFPFIIGFKVFSFFEKEKDKEIVIKSKLSDWIFTSVCAIICVVLVYFSSGYFHFQALAIASGSMSPKINIGDVAIVEKQKIDYNDIGKVIAFEYQGRIIVHRLVRIDNERYITKGDANLNEDEFIVTSSMTKGVVKFVIPYIGLPSIWFYKSSQN